MLCKQEKVDQQCQQVHQWNEQTAKKEQERSQKAMDKMLELAMTGFHAGNLAWVKTTTLSISGYQCRKNFRDSPSSNEGSVQETEPYNMAKPSHHTSTHLNISTAAPSNNSLPSTSPPSHAAKVQHTPANTTHMGTTEPSNTQHPISDTSANPPAVNHNQWKGLNI
ncbi:hypothetical protein BDN71DRAFT_1431247 [Pleurotus eryngii]|uniref:Uncharacterized protein n=1 Tax=Pleurotus eryngii TaxID=5323 RepID=A0A9P6DGI9_PLEER|nr:hypothetical protein BDN71DRAFT_1431247 [Pleurotus eryngii]